MYLVPIENLLGTLEKGLLGNIKSYMNMLYLINSILTTL